jgi:hypothetical protein
VARRAYVAQAAPAQLTVNVQPVLNSLHAALAGQGGLATGDPAVEAAMTHLTDALGPALRIATLELAQQAAAEVGAQLPDHTIEVVLVDGDPALRVTESRAAPERPPSEELDARITLRLPPSLKQLIEDAAVTGGDSVNAWVVDTLSSYAAKVKSRRGAKYTQSFDL